MDMRRIGYILATIGYVFFFGVAMVPWLCSFEPLRPYTLMTACALVVVLFGVGTQRVLPLLALVVGLMGSIHAYRHNTWLIKHMREEHCKYAVRVRELIAQTETNQSGAI